MESLKEDILQHFSSVMAPTIIKLQLNSQAVTLPTSSWSPNQSVSSLDELGEEIITCCLSLHVHEVSMHIRYIKDDIQFLDMGFSKN